MKYIVAIIQPGKLTAVHEAMLEIGISGMTVTEFRAMGLQKAKARSTVVPSTLLTFCQRSKSNLQCQRRWRARQLRHQEAVRPVKSAMVRFLLLISRMRCGLYQRAGEGAL